MPVARPLHQRARMKSNLDQAHEPMETKRRMVVQRTVPRLSGRHYRRAVACLYLLMIGLAEALMAWASPALGFVLYGLILWAFFLQATFDPMERIRRFCMALALIPLIRIVGASIPSGSLDPLIRYTILSVASLIAAGLAIRHLSLQPREVGLGLGKEPWWSIGYCPVILAAFVLAPVAYPSLGKLLQVAPPMVLLPIQAAIAFQLVSLLIGLTETLIFYGIVLYVSRDIFGDWVGVLYVALLFGVLQLFHFSWQYSLLTLVTSPLFGWAVFKKHTLYTVGLARAFINLGLLLALGPAPFGAAPGDALPAITLITLLVFKELATVVLKRKWLALGRLLDIASAPLLIVFFVTVAVKISGMLH
jgi:membrane protease YdiL (CAAX protease family)